MKSVVEQKRPPGPKSPRDPRIQRTRRALQHALGSLMHERSFEAVAIKQILARADVARATFYAHFSSKQELLESAVADAMGSPTHAAAGETHRLLRFALPLLEHVDRLRAAAPGRGALQRSFHSDAHDTLRKVIRDFVAAEAANASATGASAAASLLASQVASTFVVVLEWWLEDAPALPARDVHARFLQLAAPALPGWARI